MAWCLVKHRDNFTFNTFLYSIYGTFVLYIDTINFIVTTIYVQVYNSENTAI